MFMQHDLTDIFHRSKALLVELKAGTSKRADKVKLEEVKANLEFMYGQLALLEDQGHSGVDQNFDPHDSLDEEREGELW
jgi:hypothetical protein